MDMNLLIKDGHDWQVRLMRVFIQLEEFGLKMHLNLAQSKLSAAFIRLLHTFLHIGIENSSE